MDRRDGRNLAQLLQELGKLEGLRWIRLLYCYPRQARGRAGLGGSKRSVLRYGMVV